MGLLLEAILKRETLTEKLLSIVDDYDIYTGLIGCEMDLGEVINSPIRAKDDFPSFALYLPTRLGFEPRPEEVWFKDLADGRYGNVFRFAQYYAAHHFGEHLENRYEVIQFIDRQLELGIFSGNGSSKRAQQRNFERRVNSSIYYKSRPFTSFDLDFWKNLDLTEEDLNFWKIKSVRYLLNEGGYVRREFKRRELCFVYQFFDKEKLYQPEASRSFKFRNTCPGNDYHYYQGFEQLRGKYNGVNTLIITKSYKDVMVFYKYFNEFLDTPVDIIAPHAESINLDETFVNGIKENYDRIICVSDFDLAGVKFANQCKRYGFEYKFIDTNRIMIGGKMKVVDKDISDFRSNNGKKETLNLLRSWKLNAT